MHLARKTILHLTKIKKWLNPLNIEKIEKAGRKVHDLIIKSYNNKLFLKGGFVYNVT